MQIELTSRRGEIGVTLYDHKIGRVPLPYCSCVIYDHCNGIQALQTLYKII